MTSPPTLDQIRLCQTMEFLTPHHFHLIQVLIRRQQRHLRQMKCIACFAVIVAKQRLPLNGDRVSF